MNKGGHYQVAGAHIITKFSKTSSHETIYIYIYIYIYMFFCFVYKLIIFDALPSRNQNW